MVDSENVFSIKIDKDYIGCEKYPVFQNMSNKNEPDGQAQCAIMSWT